jgi:hypothetical protein
VIFNDSVSTPRLCRVDKSERIVTCDEIRKKPKSRWEDNFIMDLREIGCEGVDWIHLAQGRDQ